jgi:molybdopterin synthase sulfur carrier subunit
MIRLLYFASLREQLGTDREQIELPPDVQKVGELVAHLRARGGVWEQSLADVEHVLVAINQEMARPEDAVSDGDEIGLFPPVTGG